MIDSPKVATYDLQPEMSAMEVTSTIITELENGETDFICLNFANADMVGHTGDYKAIVKAVEIVDKCTQEVVEAGLKRDYAFIIISDHGNADFAVNLDGSPNTAHSTNPVPCFVLNTDFEKIENGKCVAISHDPACGAQNPGIPQNKLTLNECRSDTCYPNSKRCQDALAVAPENGKNKAHKLSTTILDKLLENNNLKRACTRDSSSLVAAIANLEDLLDNKLSEYEKFIIETLVCGFAMQSPSTDVLGKFPYAGQGPGKNPGLLTLIKSGQLQCYPQRNNHGKCSPSSRYFVSGISATHKVLKLVSMFLTTDDIKSTIVLFT